MITLDDCPRSLAVCPTMRGNLRVLKRPPPVSNADRVALLREVADRIEQAPFEVRAVAVAVSYADGDVGTGWSGDAVIPLLGAIETLRAKLARKIE